MPSNTGLMKIYPANCEKQKQDEQFILNLMEEFVAAAIALPTSGAMGYSQFIQAREHLRSSFLEVHKNYRYVE